MLKDTIRNTIDLSKVSDFKTLNDYLFKSGYFFFETKQDSLNRFSVALGKKTSLLAIDNKHPIIQDFLKTKKKIYLPPTQLKNWTNKILSFFDEQGENFTELKLTNQSIKNDTLFCELSIHRSKQRYIDKTVIKGYKKFPKRYLKHYLKSKKPFSKTFLEATEKKINQLTFAKNKKRPAVLFTKDSTYLYLYLDKVKANKLDALIGFSNQEGSSKIQFNGYVDISLNNTLHKGETLAFKWNNSGQDQQEIDLHIDNPYIFNSPINFSYQLNIFRQDSTFVNNKQQILIGYQPHYKHKINSYYHKESSNTTNPTSTTKAYSKNIFGLSYIYSEVNNWRIPKTKIELDFGFGNRKTETSTKQQIFKSNIIYNYQITPNNHIYTQNRNAYLKSENKSSNELFRIGGATTMRGFLEQSILSHLYNYTNFEYRYFNNPISYLYLFSDVGHFRNLEEKNNLLSFGLGYTLGTPSGLLKISYAIGKTQDTSFNPSNGLFHINFVTVF